ncbi:uncharacterized protein LOC121111175 isoform X8 [Gallus gallus]|uniref:uncharacterized protein LOC121111175 isoform X8 n=1 Tax=Gallus gallus TaxID=9031 RepID=UPI001AE4C375|nr:uncharacterized protein LOC121111175 isoform X8 [Gallus gallus]
MFDNLPAFKGLWFWPLLAEQPRVANFCLFKEFLLDVTCSCSGLIIPALCRKKKEQWKSHSHSARQTIDVALVWANGLPELLWSSDGFPETMIYVRFAESLHSLSSFQGCLKCNLNGPAGLHPAGRIYSTEPSCGFSTANARATSEVPCTSWPPVVGRRLPNGFYIKRPLLILSAAGTMVMSLAQVPGNINLASMLFLELDINVFIPCVHCYSTDKEKVTYKAFPDLRSQLKYKKRAAEYSRGIHPLFISLDLNAHPLSTGFIKTDHYQLCSAASGEK